jgi:hypothetical protein
VFQSLRDSTASLRSRGDYRFMDWRSAPFSRGWMIAVRVLTSTEPFIWEDLSRDAEKSDYEHRRSYDDVQRGEATGLRYPSSFQVGFRARGSRARGRGLRALVRRRLGDSDRGSWQRTNTIHRSSLGTAKAEPATGVAAADPVRTMPPMIPVGHQGTGGRTSDGQTNCGLQLARPVDVSPEHRRTFRSTQPRAHAIVPRISGPAHNNRSVVG